MDDIIDYMTVLAKFKSWMEEAERTEPSDPNAACLATVDEKGHPNARIVLLKDYDVENHYVFFTNSLSQKGQEIKVNPFASLCIYWKTTQKQVRIKGSVKKVNDDISDKYFASRHRKSRIGAWTSNQSAPLESREVLITRYKNLEMQYAENTIPRPPHWHGYQIIPEEIEFWTAGAYRLHERERYQTSTPGNLSAWRKTILNP